MEYVLLAILLVCAVVITVAVLFQKSGEKGLSGTIAGGSETYYGKDKSGGIDKKLFKWTLIAGIVFAVAVIAVYVIQPDYIEGYDVNAWKNLSLFANVFTK
jgi:preprotein translocase subunit SecG